MIKNNRQPIGIIPDWLYWECVDINKESVKERIDEIEKAIKRRKEDFLFEITQTLTIPNEWYNELDILNIKPIFISYIVLFFKYKANLFKTIKDILNAR